MKTKIFTQLDREKYPLIDECFRLGTFRLLGIHWKEKIEYSIDKLKGSIIIKYK